jgi:hypothetical protein
MAVIVGIEIEGLQQALINLTVAVFIVTVTNLSGPRVSARIPIVAVVVITHITIRWRSSLHRVTRVSEPIPVSVSKIEFTPLITSPITVVIHAVAFFVSAGIDTFIGIVTVIIIGHVAFWWGSIFLSDSRISVTISIGVLIIELATFVYVPLAIVIHVVADFRGFRVDRTISIVAVTSR